MFMIFKTDICLFCTYFLCYECILSDYVYVCILNYLYQPVEIKFPDMDNNYILWFPCSDITPLQQILPRSLNVVHYVWIEKGMQHVYLSFVKKSGYKNSYNNHSNIKGMWWKNSKLVIWLLKNYICGWHNNGVNNAYKYHEQDVYLDTCLLSCFQNVRGVRLFTIHGQRLPSPSQGKSSGFDSTAEKMLTSLKENTQWTVCICL